MTKFLQSGFYTFYSHFGSFYMHSYFLCIDKDAPCCLLLAIAISSANENNQTIIMKYSQLLRIRNLKNFTISSYV